MVLASAFGAGADSPVEPPARPALLGRSGAELREQFGPALKAQKIEPRPGHGRALLGTPAVPVDSEAPARPTPAVGVEAKDPFVEQGRLVRKPGQGDVARVEYELYRDRVYRVRWQLAERFERPWMEPLVAHLTVELGKPYYDQLIEGTFGSGRATLRRAAWRRGTRTVEVRQLTPMLGGPIFLTLSDQAAMQSIVASGGTAAPEPDSIGTWWQEPLKQLPPFTATERETLLTAFDVLFAQVGWER